MKRILFNLTLAVGLLSAASNARAFCGFYVAKADTKLFNKASQVVLTHDGDKTVITMANDFQGDLKEFAVVIPVPTFLERGQIHVGNKALIDHLDAYTAPRLVEYFDSDPCMVYEYSAGRSMSAPATAAVTKKDEAKALGVTVEATYTVGEYDILILSAKQSSGLETWLTENNYKIPNGASKILESYIKQKMHFFVAKVNLKKQAKLGFTYLRPLQVAYESPKFMLPIRLGTVNANGPQELFIYTLSPKGRVETLNYRTVKLPSDMDVPLYVKDVFGDFYRAMFAEQVRKEDMRVVFLEYAWDMGWCDPCAADPLSDDELRRLGVFWIDGDAATQRTRGFVPSTSNTFVTRMHLRYDAAHFPEDLVFQQTSDRNNFQGRYVLRHPWEGNSDCDAAKAYRKELAQRQQKDAETLASLTGWQIKDIYAKMGLPKPQPAEDKWYNKIFRD